MTTTTFSPSVTTYAATPFSGNRGFTRLNGVGAYVLTPQIAHQMWAPILGETLKLQDPNYPGIPLAAWGLSLNGGGIGLYSALTPTYGQVISEILNIQSGDIESLVSGVSIAELIQLHAALQAGFPITVNGGGIGLHDTMTIIQGVTVLNQIFLNGTILANAKYGQLLGEALLMEDALFKFFAGTIAEHIGMTDGQILQYQAIARLADSLGITASITPTLMLNVEIDEGMKLSAVQALQMIFAGDHIAEGIKIGALYVSPDGNYTTWAMNTRTGAVTEYTNYVFNSFAKLDAHEYLGASSQGSTTGLFLLEGERDLSANILSSLKGGRMAPGGSKFTSFRSAYIGIRTNTDSADFILKMIAADGREYVYSVKPQPEGVTTKVNLGKGLRSRYFSYELISASADFDLDAIEFVPIVSSRRV